MKGPDYLFVYGTLMKGFDNEMARYLSETQTFAGNGCFPGILFKVSFYPGAVYLPEAKTNVFGHLFKITGNKKELLQKLDRYEGVGPQNLHNEFVRNVITVNVEEKTYSAFVYLFDNPYESYPRIQSGDFRNR